MLTDVDYTRGGYLDTVAQNIPAPTRRKGRHVDAVLALDTHGGVVHRYENAKEAATHLSTTRSQIYGSIRTGWRHRGFQWAYEINGKPFHAPCRTTRDVPIRVGLFPYPSVKHACEAFGAGRTTIEVALKRGIFRGMPIAREGNNK